MMTRMGDRGLAIAGAALMVALSLFLAFGAAVVMKRNSLLRTVQESQQKMVRRSHESLSVSVNAEDDKATVKNYGSHTSVITVILVEQRTEAPDVMVPKNSVISVTVLSEKEVKLGNDPYNVSIQDRENVGFVTRLGNTFWGQA